MPQFVEMHSLVETHDSPFMVIDRSFRIVAANQAFAKTYGSNPHQVEGRHCYEVTHGNDRPCSDMGCDCPHKQVYETQETHSCLHIHHDHQGNRQRVRVTVFPLRAHDGELYVGEAIQELSEDESPQESGISMAGACQNFLRMAEQLVLAAHADTPVLLHGETGTGKELAASFLHHNSQRANGPFLTLDCTVLTETLFESEVFGHEHGAFTGSQGRKIGLFELAHRGTLFLDEIGELSPVMQAKLLRVLETGEFRRLGGTQTLHADVRVVCATNRDLRDEVKSGGFRGDLYYRIAGFAVSLPSLRERTGDIPILADALLTRIGRSRQRRLRLTDNALDWLQQQEFPGNIRELRNVLSAAAALTQNDMIRREQLEKVYRHGPQGAIRAIEKPHLPVPETEAVDLNPPGRRKPVMTLTELELQEIRRLLAATGGNRNQVAEALGISVRTLYRKLKKYGLN